MPVAKTMIDVTAPPAKVGEVLDLPSMFLTLWRARWRILSVMSFAAVVAGFWAQYLAVPRYLSTAVVVMAPQADALPDMGGVLPGLKGDSSLVNTEVEVLRSRSLMTRVVRELKLDRDPEFNVALKGPGFAEKLFNRVYGALGRPPVKLRKTAPAHSLVNSAAMALTKAVTIRNVPDTLVFEVIVESIEPTKATVIANQIANFYILSQIEAKYIATEQATEWLGTRVSDLKVALEQAETAAKSFATDTDLVSEGALDQLARQQKDLRARIFEAEITLREASLRLTSLRNATGAEARAIAAADKILDRLYRDGIGGAKSKTAFEARFDAIEEKAALAKSRNENRLAALNDAITALDQQIERQSLDLVKLQQFQREAEASRSIYEFFLGRLKETSVQQGVHQADSRILSEAVVPDKAFAPRAYLVVVMSALLGGLLGVGMVLAQEAQQNTFRTSEELELVTGYTVMGQIPLIPAQKRADVLKYVVDKPASAAAEGVRNLRTSLLLNGREKPPQVILSTSSVPGEGKTTQSLTLAQNLSAMGKRVLVIEGDLRRRVFGAYFSIKPRSGLISVLNGNMPLEQAVWCHEGLGIDILIGEAPSGNAADVFSSVAFGRFLGEARRTYDHIIIDTPPVLVVPDTRVIGQVVDEYFRLFIGIRRRNLWLRAGCGYSKRSDYARRVWCWRR